MSQLPAASVPAVRMHAAAGSAWLDVCQGSADAALVPLLLSAATQSGAAVDVAALTEAQRGIKGDLNQALVDLDKVSSSRHSTWC